MIDKKKFKNAINKSQKAMQNAPTDQSMTVDVKNEELEAQIKVYTKEKTRENLNQLIEIARKCRLLVPANLNEQNQPVPCLLNSQENGLFFPAYTSKEQIPQEPKSPAIINMPYLAINEVACRQAEHIGGIVINPFTDNLVFKMPLVQRIEEVEKARKNAGKVKTMQLTPEQYVLFERKQFEFGFLPRRLFENGKESTIAPIIITARKESDTFFGAESRPECFRLVKTISFITKSPIIASILTPRCDKSNTSLSLRHNIE